jgi:hypothetical protein
MPSSENHAIVFGAAGLLGWAVLNQLLSGYPSSGSFSTVTAVMNRPVAESDLQLPEASGTRPALQMASGVDLLSGTAEDLAAALKSKVPNVGSVTHVFCFGTCV